MIIMLRVIIKTLATIGNNETNQSSVCESLAAECLMSSFPMTQLRVLITSGSSGDTASGSQWGQAGWSPRLGAQGSCQNIIAVFTFMKNVRIRIRHGN